MAAYDPSAWSDLFVATAGAAAALAGLVFVAISINIGRILQLAGVPERGLQTVLLLLGAVVVSILGLVPQRTGTFAIELVVGAALVLPDRGQRAQDAQRNAGAPGVRGDAAVPRGAGERRVPRRRHQLAEPVERRPGVGRRRARRRLVGAVLTAWVLLVEILR